MELKLLVELIRERLVPNILVFLFLVAFQKVLHKPELKHLLFTFHHPSQLMLFLKLSKLKFLLLFVLLRVFQLLI
jgi:hypothetical protein